MRHGGGQMEVTLADGLVIDKENRSREWLIEVFAGDEYASFFRKALDEGRELDVEAVISRADNPPAPFRVKTRSVRKLGGRISVLLEGKLAKPEENSAEQILSELIEQGLCGDELLEAFKKRTTARANAPRVNKKKDA